MQSGRDGNPCCENVYAISWRHYPKKKLDFNQAFNAAWVTIPFGDFIPCTVSLYPNRKHQTTRKINLVELQILQNQLKRHYKCRLAEDTAKRHLQCRFKNPLPELMPYPYNLKKGSFRSPFSFTSI